MHTIFKIGFTCHTPSGGKFWSCSLGMEQQLTGLHPVCATHYGRLKTKGSTGAKYFESFIDAWGFMNKKLKEKTNKGYVIDPTNTSKHFVIAREVAGEFMTEKAIQNLEKIGLIVKNLMRTDFSTDLQIILEPQGITTKTKEPVKSNPKLDEIMALRRASAKFVF